MNGQSAARRLSHSQTSLIEGFGSEPQLRSLSQPDGLAWAPSSLADVRRTLPSPLHPVRGPVRGGRFRGR